MPHFDWKRYSAELAGRLQSEFAIELREQKWVESDELLAGFGANLAIAPILLSPLATPIFWVMSHSDANLFASVLLTGKAKEAPFASEALSEGYYRYLLLEALDLATTFEPINQFTVQLSEEANLPEERAFCIDTHLIFSNATCWGRLIIPLSAKNSLARYFAQLPYAPVAAHRAREIELNVAIRIGLVQIAIPEWETIKVGDALILDRGSYQPEDTLATLMLGSIPVFQARVERNRVTILEYAFYNEESMETPEPLNDATLEPKSEEGAVAIQNYPVSIAVELGRLKITLEQLMRLSAGNTLELPIQPHQGVALTVNGRLIGRGEIVAMGEAIAVRVLEIAS